MNLMKSFLILTILSSLGCGKEILVSGPKGDKGDPGLNGTNGISCEVAPVAVSLSYPNGGAVITCGTNMVVVQNGSDGQDGATGAPGPAGANAVLELIDPCGDAPSVYDEVILRLSTGQLLASFSENANGKNTRFSVITPGSYVTTDGTNCVFNVNSSGAVSW